MHLNLYGGFGGGIDRSAVRIRRCTMELKSMRDPEKITLGEAEELKNNGAYLEMDSRGWICVYEGENELERDTGHIGQ